MVIKNIEMETQIFAHVLHGEGEIRDRGGLSEGKELTAGAVMVFAYNRKTLRNQ